jgi:two-component system cell cycle sensor histidine kinase/response regulator CckA
MRTILVVDDEEAVREMLRHVLRSFGYDIMSAANGEDAVMILQTSERPVDVLLSDAVLPHLDGWTLAETARQIRPEIKCVIMSGYVDDSHFLTGTRFGCEFIAKPFGLPDLMAVLEKSLHDEIGVS